MDPDSLFWRDNIKTSSFCPTRGHSCTKSRSLWDSLIALRQHFTDFISQIHPSYQSLVLHISVWKYSQSPQATSHMSTEALYLVIFRKFPLPTLSQGSDGPVQARGRGVVGKREKSSTMISLTWCPTWAAQLEFTFSDISGFIFPFGFNVL